MATKLEIEKRGDEILKESSPLKLLSQFQPNFAEMILGWSPFKFMSVSTVLYPRWPPLLKIEISSNGKNLKVETKLPRNDHWKVLYKVTVFYADRKSKMAATAGHRLTLDAMGNVQMPSSQKLQIRLNPN